MLSYEIQSDAGTVFKFFLKIPDPKNTKCPSKVFCRVEHIS